LLSPPFLDFRKQGEERLDRLLDALAALSEQALQARRLGSKRQQRKGPLAWRSGEIADQQGSSIFHEPRQSGRRRDVDLNPEQRLAVLVEQDFQHLSAVRVRP
jgi:hypothetical protein